MENFLNKLGKTVAADTARWEGLGGPFVARKRR
jgi:hypothetical protein